MRFGRVLAGLALGVGAVATSADVAAAARIDAAAFAADCNADGTVDVTGVLRVVGGTGAITTTCVVTLDAGEKLVVRGADLSGSALIVTTGSPSGADTTVKVIDSRIDMSGPLQLSPGAVAGDAAVPDSDASVIVRRSTLRASDIELSTSLDWARGRVVVVDSDLVVPVGAGSVTLGASLLGGIDGLTRVVDSTISTAGSVTIRSGDSGRTVVRDSAVAGGSVEVSTGAAGVCRTRGNVPALVCS